MKILSWDKPKRKMPIAEWKGITADSAPPGVYIPNMSDEDRLKWKAKHIKGDDERVEIRKTFSHSNNKVYPNLVHYSSQVLIVVRWNTGSDEPNVLISTNGKMATTIGEVHDLYKAVQEAVDVLMKSNR